MLKTEPRFVGFDPGITCAGLALIHGTEVLHSTTLSPPKRSGELMPYFERLEWLDDHLSIHLDSYGEIDGFAIEGYNMGGSKQFGTWVKAEVGGMVRLNLYRRYAPIFIIPPKSLLKFTTGSGSTNSKEPTKDYVERNFGFRPKKSDEADAIGLADMGRVCLSGDRQGLNQAQREAIIKVERIAPKLRPRIRTRS